MRRFSAVLTLIALLVPGALAVTPNTPVVDGVITVGPADWDPDELINQPPNPLEPYPGDSAWGAGNEVGDLYVTWDATDLYIGVVNTLGGGNTIDVWIVAGDGSTCTDATGITWGKRILFVTPTLNPDYVVHHSGGFSQTFSIASNASSTDLNPTWGGSAVQGPAAFEIRFPWATIGLQPNQRIAIVTDISGGGWDSCDANPNQVPQPNGDGAPDPYSQLWRITVADGGGVPLVGVLPVAATTQVPVELSVFSTD